jgi:hypothetical protein
MKKYLLPVLIALAVLLLMTPLIFRVSHYYGIPTIKQKAEADHIHGWSMWQAPVEDTSGQPQVEDKRDKIVYGYIQFHQCTNCGLVEVRRVEVVK